jgi:hypothetical protein
VKAARVRIIFPPSGLTLIEKIKAVVNLILRRKK